MTLDMMSYNRAHLNNRRIHRIDTKVMVFIVPSVVRVGVVNTELRFPYKGKLVDIYATCGTTGSSSTVIDIEKCSQVDYDSTPVWESIFNSSLIIDANQKSNKTSATPYSINSDYLDVNADEHFRINVLDVGGVKDITVELVVELSIEE